MVCACIHVFLPFCCLLRYSGTYSIAGQAYLTRLDSHIPRSSNTKHSLCDTLTHRATTPGHCRKPPTSPPYIVIDKDRFGINVKRVPSTFLLLPPPPPPHTHTYIVIDTLCFGPNVQRVFQQILVICPHVDCDWQRASRLQPRRSHVQRQLSCMGVIKASHLAGRSNRFKPLGTMSRDCLLEKAKINMTAVLKSRWYQPTEFPHKRPCRTKTYWCAHKQIVSMLLLFLHC
jgi:hypothetical protein